MFALQQAASSVPVMLSAFAFSLWPTLQVYTVFDAHVLLSTGFTPPQLASDAAGVPSLPMQVAVRV